MTREDIVKEIDLIIENVPQLTQTMIDALDGAKKLIVDELGKWERVKDTMYSEGLLDDLT